MKVSVVIPTLGGDCLARTIEHLNHGTLVPAEVLVCIPEEYVPRVAGLSAANVRLIKTGCKGQVAQRAIGFQQAEQPLVLQLDDDTVLEQDTLASLAEALVRMGPGNALAPVCHIVETGRCSHELGDGLRGWLMNLFTYVVCGAPWGVKRMGVMTAIGTSYGVDGHYCDSSPFPTQWLPGACVLCFKQDLIKDNFFPYSGKAYCEDLIHSLLRVKNGIRLWVIPTVRCLMGATRPEADAPSVQAQRNAQRYVVRLKGGPRWRLALYEMLSDLKRAIRSLARTTAR